MNTRKRVERLFKFYNQFKQNLGILECQITNFVGPSDEEIIQSLNYLVPEGERVSTSSIANKAARIAFSYRDVLTKESREMLCDMSRRYYEQKNELELFEHCISVLNPKISAVIWDMVVNKMTWDELEQKHYVSRQTISVYRKKAIERIVEMMDNAKTMAS